MSLDRLTVLFLLGVLVLLPFTVTAERSDKIDVELILPEDQRRVRTTARTVEGLLETENFNALDFDRTFPAPDSRLADGMKIFLYRETEQASISKEPQRTETRTVYSSVIPKGRKLVVRGSAKASRPPVVAFNDDPASTRARIVMRGGPQFKADQVDELVEKGEMAMLATGYSSHPKSTAPFDDGVSALGLQAGYGLVAVDPQVIPLGTRLYVEGYGYAIAADVGGGIDNRQIDLCFDSHQAALNFGRRWVKVHILG